MSKNPKDHPSRLAGPQNSMKEGGGKIPQ